MSESQLNHFDIFVVGGGINGVGIARDAAGRGLSVCLVEQNDLASATSSASSKLIHGGLRYLENYEFHLVRESLRERETLMSMAPHLIHPMRFVLPHHSGLRPAFILRIGLWLYDHLGGRKLLPVTKTLNLADPSQQSPLKTEFKKGFEYSDCWVDDSRLVIINAIAAAEKGASILTRHRFLRASKTGDCWRIEYETPTHKRISATARVIVNAAGPWVDMVQEHLPVMSGTVNNMKLVKGSHIVVPKLYEGSRAYTFQGSDGRVVFAIPYRGDYTLIGTTDVPYHGEPARVKIDKQEIEYLCDLVSGYFASPVTPEQVVWSFSGVRPLYDDGEKNASKLTRDYVLDLEADEKTPPLLSIYGGKVTTYRRLAEDVLEKLSPFIPHGHRPWTHGAVLPGGDIEAGDFDAFYTNIQARNDWLSPALLRRLCLAYGTRVAHLLEGVEGTKDLGIHFGAGLYEREVTYLMAHEWAQTAEDILWRRSKLGLCLTATEQHTLSNWMAAHEQH
ncbi:glycerol-3-phosphate dehydrogenase [Kordiimonas aestuarii]|uniref:glycerol-3-phosphate dehydrogenase n=1 Tax=Kordiimonas aestuarii TaxID=1005925 RepID=UPI0021D29444|nr:glycerol-3-phosphate dehydrogenase [Kordiimonas aestuarii]